MNYSNFIFCGGPAIYDKGRPKSLMKIREGKSLLVHYLIYLELNTKIMPTKVYLLCDDKQESLIKADIKNITYPVPIEIIPCGKQPNTFEKFCRALNLKKSSEELVRFGYPDIFLFDELTEVNINDFRSNKLICISATPLTSRFPRLIIDVYNNKVKGISNYTSPVPANPLYVFGGDLWGSTSCFINLVKDFQLYTKIVSPSLEYDFFFWLINHNKMNCIILHGKILRIDSLRDINELKNKTANFFN